MDMEWMEDVELPKILGEKDGFDPHIFSKQKEVSYTLPSGEKSCFKVNIGKSLELNLDTTLETTTSNLFINNSIQTTTNTTLTW